MKTEFCKVYKSYGTSYEILDHICVLSKSNRLTAWSKELNFVKWSDNVVGFDIREWDESHARFTRGITLTAEELARLLVECEELIERVDNVIKS